MLFRKAKRHSGRGQAANALPQSRKGIDRRTFFNRSGLTVGALAVLGDLPLGCFTRRKAARRLPRVPRLTPARTSARIVRSAVRLSQQSRTACGSGRSQTMTARSIVDCIAARSLRFAMTS
jgi:hypothetical protein